MSAGADGELVVTRVVPAPVDAVWAAWSTPEQIMRWWGPDGFTCPLAEVDFRVGGTTLVCMQAPAEYGGRDMYTTWTYTAIVPNQRIEFVSNFADAQGRTLDRAEAGIPPGVPRGVPHVVTFAELDGGRCEVSVAEFGYTSAEARDLSKQGQEQVMDKFTALFAA